MMVIYAQERSCVTQFEPGEMYEKAELCQRDYGKAFKWYRMAARRGFRRAQHRLGSLCARGLGVPQDLPQACTWCRVAAARDSRPARRRLRQIEAHMSTEELRRGRWLAQDYYDRYVAPLRSRSGRPFEVFGLFLESSCDFVGGVNSRPVGAVTAGMVLDPRRLAGEEEPVVEGPGERVALAGLPG